MSQLFAAMLLVLLGCSCTPETGLTELHPEIAVAPPDLDFGGVGVPLQGDLELYVTNSGRAPLVVDLSFLQGGAGVFTMDVDHAEIEPEETLVVPVHFSPETFLSYADTLRVTSNDKETPTVDIPVLGEGVSAPLPDIEIEPTVLDFGVVPEDTSDTQYVTIKNVGTAPLHLGQVTQSGSGNFQMLFDPSDATIAPDNETPVIIVYEPPNGAGDSGFLTIPSNDPDENDVQVVILGNGGGNFDYPEAVIDCPGSSEPPEWITLDGSASTDPSGNYPLEFAWSLTEKPDGSQTDLTNLVTDNTELFTDVAGTYVVQLQVTNTLGVASAPTKCTIEAIPSDDLHIELTWDTSKADLDLHVQESVDVEWFDKPGDCNYCNPNPDWATNSAEDDPRLDIDDRGGLGPENINIDVPADGAFPVKVHYFDSHGDNAVTATIRVYTYGVLADTQSRVIYRNEVWDVGVVNWPEGTVGVASAANWETEVRECW